MADFSFSPGTASQVPYGVLRSQAAPYVEDDWANTYADLLGSKKAYPTWVRGVINDTDITQNGLYVCTAVNGDSSTWDKLVTLKQLQEIIKSIPTPGTGDGEDGEDGEDGKDGEDGRTLRIYTGQNEPAGDLGLPGDYYIRFNGRMYERMPVSWESRGALALGGGLVGGRSFYFGLVEPDKNTKLPVDLPDGATYLNTATGFLYAMENGTWVYLITMLGKKGDKGNDGASGTIHLVRPTEPTDADGQDGYLWTNYVTLTTERRYIKLNGKWFKYYDNVGTGGTTPGGGTVPPIPTSYTSTKSFTAECPAGSIGTPVTKEATKTSTKDQDDADNLALAAAKAAAKAELVCEVPTVTYTATKSFTAKCGTGETGADVTREATRTSTESQNKADELALAAATAAATAALVCTPVTTPTPTVTAYVGSFRDNDVSAATVQAATVQQWDKGARTLTIEAKELRPGFAEPQSQGIRSLTDSNGFTLAEGFDYNRTAITLTIAGQPILYWLYVHLYEQEGTFTYNLLTLQA